MKTIELGFLQRFKLSELLGIQQGPLGKTAPYLRIMEKVRFTDVEAKVITQVRINDTQVSVQAPATFANISVELEDADCTALRDLLEIHPTFTTADHLWADPVLAALRSS